MLQREDPAAFSRKVRKWRHGISLSAFTGSLVRLLPMTSQHFSPDLFYAFGMKFHFERDPFDTGHSHFQSRIFSVRAGVRIHSGAKCQTTAALRHLP